jgi:hypothetical protein
LYNRISSLSAVLILANPDPTWQMIVIIEKSPHIIVENWNPPLLAGELENNGKLFLDHLPSPFMVCAG